MTVDRNEKAKSILYQIKYITLATANEDGSPWNSPVFFGFDDHLNIYWSSHSDSCHSQNVTRTGKVFGVVYNSTSNDGDGVYIEASAGVVSDNAEIEHALNVLGERRGRPFKHIEKFMPPGPQRIFKAIPLKIWMNDADQDKDGDFIRDYRNLVDISLLAE